MGNGCGLQIDRFSPHYEPYEFILDDFQDLGHFELPMTHRHYEHDELWGCMDNADWIELFKEVQRERKQETERRWSRVRNLVILRRVGFYWMEQPARNTTRARDHMRAVEEYEND